MSATEEREAEVGKSIEDAADDAPAQQPLPGTAPTLSLSAGGDAPTSSSIKLRGGSLALEGQFNKGEVVAVWVEIRVSEVQFVDKIDVHGNVSGTERRHLGRMTSVQRA